MKKILAIVLVAILSLLTVSAFAEDDMTNYAFGFTAQCLNETQLNHASIGVARPKQGTNNFIEVRHSVSGNGSSYGYTNLMYAYMIDYDMYVGRKWQLPNGIYYSCTSDNLHQNVWVVPGGRGNTKYAEEGLSSLYLEGQFRVH